MAKQANPTLIGAFIVGATALVLGGFLAFGGRSYFRPDFKLVAHFDSSVSGLDVGAPVRLRGINIGSVTDIDAVWLSRGEDIRIPVELTIVEGVIRAPGDDTELGTEPHSTETDQIVTQMIEHGLRAELSLDSIVTGKMFVSLDFHPGTEAKLLGDTKYVEVPTIEAGFARIRKSLEDLPLHDALNSAISAFKAVEELAANPGISTLIDDLNVALKSVEGQIDPVFGSLQSTLEEARAFVSKADSELQLVSADLRTLLSTTDSQIEPVSSTAIAALEEARTAIARLSALVTDDSSLSYRLTTMLDEITSAAAAVRNLAAYLERHPEAVLSGKGK